MTAAEVLRQARDLIADPKRWNTVDPAADASGKACDPCDPNAARWCALGALERVTGVDTLGATATCVLQRVIGGWVGPWNDSVTHAEVLAAFDRAIAAAEGAQP